MKSCYFGAKVNLVKTTSMGLSSADLREIKSTIISTFNDKFLQDIAEKVARIIENKFEERFKEQNDRITSLEAKIEKLEGEYQQVRNNMDSQEQSLRSLNIRIFGVKVQEGEDVRATVQDLFTKTLKCNIQNSDINKCYRVPSKNINDRPPAILVQFANDAARVSIFKSRKYLHKSGIQIKEDLTKFRLALLNSAVNQFAKTNVWTLNGNIYVKCGDSVRRIGDERELSALKK